MESAEARRGLGHISVHMLNMHLPRVIWQLWMFPFQSFDPQDASFLACQDFFFTPIPVQKLNNEYSIDEKLLDYGCRQALDFPDIYTEMMGSRGKQESVAHHRAMNIYDYLDSRFICLARNKGPKSHRRPLTEISRWRKTLYVSQSQRKNMR